MALNEEQKRHREGRIGASFIPYLMAGDERKIVLEWQRLVDHPDYQEEDLSGSWPVQFGSWVEGFALDWHQAKTGMPLIHRGQSVVHPDLPHVGCTLDAFRRDDKTVIDCKAPSKWRKLEDVLAFYPGQMVVQKRCVGADRAALLVVHGGDEPAEHEVIWDPDYEREVWDRVNWFWNCVQDLTCPGALPAAKAPEPVVRIVDMSGSNSWAEHASIWLKTKDANRLFNDAAKGLKGLVQDDVAKAHGHGVCVSRSKAGSLSVKEAR